MLNTRSEILNTSYAAHSTYQKFQNFIIDLSKIYSTSSEGGVISPDGQTDGILFLLD